MLKGCSQGLAVGQGSSAPKLWSKERAKETPYTRSPGSPKADQVDSAAGKKPDALRETACLLCRVRVRKCMYARAGEGQLTGCPL